MGSTSIAGVDEDEEVEGARASDTVTRSCSLPEQLGALVHTRARLEGSGKVNHEETKVF